MIAFNKARKEYGKLTAVDDLDLEIPNGEFFGLLGPNGAGKTTIVKMATALTPLTSGSIEIDGEPTHRDQSKVKRTLGIVPQYSNFEPELTARQNLDYHGRLYGMAAQSRKSRIEELLTFAELSDRADEKANTYSGGMKRRLMIIKSLMHSPKIMFLDEPTVGLDVTARRKIWDLLKGMNENGLTIFLTTHYLEEAQALCSRVGLIDNGKLIQLGSPETIIALCGKYALEYFESGETKRLFFEDRAEAAKAAEGLNTVFQVREANLEDAFVRLTNRRID